MNIKHFTFLGVFKLAPGSWSRPGQASLADCEAKECNQTTLL